MIIPVFDVKGNQCVSGKSGKRDTYTRLESVYGDDILDIARNLKMSGAKSVYSADLDKIEGCGDNSSLISQVNDIIPVLLDNGANCVDDIVFNKNICTYSILASESMTNLNDIRNIFEELPYEKLIISVDIKDNELLVEDKDIKFSDVISLINDVKPDYSILLNISQVQKKEIMIRLLKILSIIPHIPNMSLLAELLMKVSENTGLLVLTIF